MTDEMSPERPGRRPRYRGKNPRNFHEKYKEHHPDLYANDVAKVIASGRTPAGMHRPIMVREILDVLAPKPGEIAVDATLGYGGHARELLSAVQPGGRLIAMDADPIELPRAEQRLRDLGFPPESVVARQGNFASLAAVVAAEAPGGVDLVLADLGLSSMQIDDPSRGFTFKGDGPLDMRMNPARGRPAHAWLSSLSAGALAQVLAENADERYADELAAAILDAHLREPLATTQSLDGVVAGVGRRWRLSNDETASTVRRVFQALRIAVNDEFGALESLLKGLPRCLKPGGRVAVLSFHSGEDRRVKAAFKAGLQAGLYATISGEIVRASPLEQRDNPRSASAKLRSAVRAG